MKGQSNISKPQQDTGNMIYLPLSTIDPRLKFVTAEYPVQSKKTTLKDKSNPCKNNSLNIKSSKTLVQDLTSKEKGLFPFWNKQVKDMSLKLWLPTKIDLLGLELKSSNGLSTKMVENSCFSTTLSCHPKKSLQQIYYPSSMFSHVECTVLGNTAVKSKKIRAYPSQLQKKILKKWFGTARFVYNKTVEFLNKPDTKANWMGIKTDIIKALPDWADEIPYQIKSLAIKDACIAFKVNKMKAKQTGQPFKIKYRSRKNKQNIYLPKQSIKHNGFYKRKLGNMKFAEAIPIDIMDSRFTFEYNNYWIVIPTKIIKQQKPVITKQPIVALDPGIRTFQAFYSELAVGEIANDFYGKTLLKHIVALDDMVSKLYLKKNKDGSKAKKRKLSKKAKVLKKEFGFNFVHKSKKKKTKQ